MVAKIGKRKPTAHRMQKLVRKLYPRTGVVAQRVMADIVVVYIVMAYIVMAYIVMAHIVMAYIGMARIVEARMVRARTMPPCAMCAPPPWNGPGMQHRNLAPRTPKKNSIFAHLVECDAIPLLAASDRDLGLLG